MENKWFEHRSTAHSTQTIREMIVDYGYAGYGWYNVLLEKLSIEPERKIEIRSIRYIADEFKCTEQVLKDFIMRFFDVDDDHKYFRSEKLDSLLERYDKTIEQRSLAGVKSAEKRKKSGTNQEITISNEQSLNDRSTIVQHKTLHENTLQNNDNTIENIKITGHQSKSEQTLSHLDKMEQADETDFLLSGIFESDDTPSEEKSSIKRIKELKENILEEKNKQSPDYDKIEIWDSILTRLTNPKKNI